MNVKCRPAERLTATNFDQFGNLRLGPQLMKDIKKMLTHTMRNPYDKNAMKGNLIVMQDYKPPAGQLFPNGALIAGPERVPSNVYVPAKQILQPNLNPSFSDSTYTASTPDTKYIPAGFTNQLQDSDAEVFQRQRLQNAQYVQNNRIQTTPNTDISNFSNVRARQFIQQNSRLTNSAQQPNYNYNQRANPQYTQRNNAENTFTTNAYTNQRGQLNRQRAQYTDVRKPTQFNSGNQNEIVPYAKQQYNEEKQPYTYRQPNPTFSSELDVGKELKQNLVSTPVPATVITKTLTYSKLIQEPKPGRPKSRITVKTWIVKPKSGRLIAEPTPYTYDRPTQTPAERLVKESSAYVYTRPTLPPQPARLVMDEKPKPYVYNRPTASPQVEGLMTDDRSKPYVYNRPTIPPPPRIVEADEPKPYVYNRPTVASKLVATSKKEPPSRAYLPPSPTQPTIPQTQAARLNLPQSPPPTQSSKTIFPTTFKPSSRLYLAPALPENAQIVSRQYLAPLQQAPYYQSSQLRAALSTPATAPMSSNGNINGNNNNLSYTVKKPPTNTSRKNLTFTDILTKEKLDLTVSDIVKDTGNILQTASPPQFGQYVEGTKSVNDPDIIYLPAENESGEDLTSEAPSSTTASKSARLIAQPASYLEPPAENFNNNQNTNHLSNLPFYKASAIPNTIERTVSLKITLPERVASYIFRGGNETDYDNLEILNTGSSNYLVLTNNMLNQGGNFINIGKLSENKNANVSNSQALVFSFLADSLNAAKKYSNVAKQDILTSMWTQAPQNQNLNNEDLSHIANKLSQLTSSQYSTNNNRSPNTTARIQTITGTSQSNQAKYTNNEQNSTQPTQSAQYNIAPSLQTQEQLYSSPYQTDNNGINANLLESNQDAIYSGQLYQLPVPEVTSQIYNRPQSGNLAQTNLQHQKQITSPPQTTNQNNNLPNHNNLIKQSSAEVEIVQSKTFPLTPAKLQLAPTNEPESFYSQESWNSLLNSDNGISAQLQDKIVGIIPHPLEDSKLVSYEKDQSYYLYTKLDNNAQSNPSAATPNNIFGRQNTKLTRGNNIPNVITFQFVPSVSYQLEDEKEQQKLLNSFQIDEFGAPWDAVKANLVQESNQQEATMVSNIDFTVEHPSSRQTNSNSLNALYKGPSSYSAPQGSIGNLPRQTLLANNLSSRLEQLDIKSNNDGYPKTVPARRFVF